MEDEHRKKEQLMQKLAELHQRVAELEVADTERRRAEEALRESEEKYRTLVERSLQGLVVVQDFHIVFANTAFAEISGYTVEEVLSLSPAEVKAMIHPEDQALVWGRFRDRLAGKPVPPRYEYRGIRKAGTVRWLEMFASQIEYDGKPAIQEAIVDITEHKRAEEELRQSHAQLQRTLEGIVNTLVLAIEMRDPYTAGHQRRVTKLACAIAKEMGLPEERIEGIRMAALIHDLGKINVPAGILSKPGPLSDLEYSLIKMHSQIGHDVLKTVEFPWPIAQIVFQHHCG